ncbi:MAG: hypothetical protein AABY13_02650, partial [Nanoarchaeota archaeon]
TQVIRIIHEKMRGNHIMWVLVGSTNLQLQGMHVAPRDLDIVIQHKDLEKVRELFSEYSPSDVQELKTLSGERAWDVHTTIKGIECQFFG